MGSSSQDNVAILETLVTFLKDNGNRQAILSETGGGETASCYTEYAPSPQIYDAHRLNYSF